MPYYPIAEVPNEATIDCDAIAYEFTGAVQTHAGLLVLDLHTQALLQWSTSVERILRIDAKSLQSASVSASLLGLSDDITDFLTAASRGSQEIKLSVQSERKDRFLLRAHRNSDRILISVEPERMDIDVSLELLATLPLTILERLSTVENLDEAANATAKILSSSLQFERCLVYQFDQDWHGQVIGESLTRADLEPYLHLRFPATDIPKSARRLYSECKLRCTVDLAAEPSEIVPAKDPLTGRYTNLARSHIRSVAQSCRDYYLNMSVRATCVVPILVNGAVWGHISCFHSQPRRVPPCGEQFLYAAGLAFSKTVANIGLSARIAAEETALKVQYAIATVVEPKHASPKLLEHSLGMLMKLLSSDYACIKLEDEVISVGQDLESSKITELLGLLRDHRQVQAICTDRLAIDFPQASEISHRFAGMLAVPLDKSWSEAMIMLRERRDESTAWLGNPQEGLRWDSAGRPTMRPRASFEKYLAQTAQSSRPWTEEEKHIANSCTLTLGVQLLRMKAQAARTSQQSFLANMSHEIRTPLTAILGFTDVLEQEELEPKQAKELIGTIRRNGQHLLTVINDILDFSKIQSGQLAVEIAEFSVTALVTEIEQSFLSTAVKAGLELTVVIASGVPRTIRSDVTRVRQILINLVGNALKFTKKGTVSVRLNFDQTKRLLIASISDSGIGMNSEQLSAIREFQPFRQADVSVTRRFGGTGLGLAICKSLTSILGGSLEVDAIEGRGSVFTFSVQDHGSTSSFGDAGSDLARRSVQAFTSLPEVSREPEFTLKGLRILLAEDGLDNQRLISHLLRKAGAKVDIAENGQIAVDNILQKRCVYDLILMDMQMPILDGYSATRQLREAGYSSPIIGLSAHALAEQKSESITAGCNDYCTKPIDKQKLFAVCRLYGRPR